MTHDTTSSSSSIKHPMASESSFGCFNRVNIDGTNVGAAMFIRRGTGREPEGCCCINIYVNSNVQGSTHAVMLGSSIKMTDPGVHLHFGEGCAGSDKRARSANKLGFLAMFFVVLISLLLLISPFLLL